MDHTDGVELAQTNPFNGKNSVARQKCGKLATEVHYFSKKKTREDYGN